MEPSELDLFLIKILSCYIKDLRLCCFLCGPYYDRKLVDRVSLRLQTAVSFYDIWLHTGILWKSQFYGAPSTICSFIGWVHIFFPVVYAFFNMAIGINLQLVFLHNKSITKRIELAYWIGSILLSLIISLPPLAHGKLGNTEYYGCFIADEAGGAQFIVSGETSMDSETSARAVNIVKFIGYRILLYPLTMLISHSPKAISNAYNDFSPTSSGGLDQWTWMFLPWAGTLNFIAFCCDPTVHEAFRVIYNRIRNGKNFEKDNEETPQVSKLRNRDDSLEDGKHEEDLKLENANKQIVNDLIKSL